MKLKNLIQDAANMLGIDAPQKSPIFSILFRCANLVVSNVACNYEDCVATQTFDVTDGRIDLSKFKKTFLKVKSCNVNYDLYINSLSVPNGMVTVQYAYIPKFTSGNNVITTVAGRLTESALLYGILAEYASISGLTDEEKRYNEKFEDLLFACTRTGSARVMK